MRRGFKPEYVVGPTGKKRAVVLSLTDYERLLEDYRDLQIVAARKANLKVPATVFLMRLRKLGRV